MVALAADKNIVRAGRHLAGSPTSLGVAAATRIYAGAAACKNAAGFAVPAGTTANLRTLGVARKQYDNTGGADGAVTGEFDMGDHFFANLGGDAVTDANIGALCYWADDQTVSATNGAGARPNAAGRVIRVDPTYGVLVRVGVGLDV